MGKNVKQKTWVDIAVSNFLKLFFSITFVAMAFFALLTLDISVNVSMKREKNFETIKGKSFLENALKFAKTGYEGYKKVF